MFLVRIFFAIIWKTVKIKIALLVAHDDLWRTGIHTIPSLISSNFLYQIILFWFGERFSFALLSPKEKQGTASKKQSDQYWLNIAMNATVLLRENQRVGFSLILCKE